MKTNNQNFTLVDVLSKESYNEGHIPGAINLHLRNLERLAKQSLDREETIVVYCESYGCQASTTATKNF